MGKQVAFFPHLFELTSQSMKFIFLLPHLQFGRMPACPCSPLVACNNVG